MVGPNQLSSFFLNLVLYYSIEFHGTLYNYTETYTNSMIDFAPPTYLINPSFVFSYWIFGWFLLYYAGYTMYSPFFALICASIFVCCGGAFMVFSISTNYTTFIAGILSNTAIKAVPLLLLWNQNGWIAPLQRDVIITTIAFFVYNIWLGVNGETFVSIYTSIYDGIVANKPRDIATWFTKLIIDRRGQRPSS
jgi:hypothetical protein